MKRLRLHDKEIQRAINNELKRQEEHIELIASENFVSEDVLNATGSVLTNKYGEGYPAKRYYGGCENIDVVETLAIERAKKLFNVKYANVQPYSGSVANAAAFAALINQGDKIMGLTLASGGHLTHGYKISFSGIFYEAHPYVLDENDLLDYDAIEKYAMEIKPKLIIAGYSAYSRIVDFARFRQIADKVGAYLLADIAHIAGLIAVGLHPSPVGYAHVITTTTHKTLRSARGGLIMTDDDEISKKINRFVFPGFQGGPLFHAIAGKAVGFYEALQPWFKKYMQQVSKNAQVFADYFLSQNVKVVSNGTDTHLFILDVKYSYDLTGKQAEEILSKVNITTNKNTIPNETLSPLITSGLRLGTPAMTSRGFKEKDFLKLAKWIHKLLSHPKDEQLQQQIKLEISQFSKKFPLKKSYWPEK
ncbi:serine hydroxymethyltransferase [Mesomycoplasma hyorhinis]|uniref:Serine hydroxymethyltransferase n=1 Tax=Mesomycoplasma hyorhinis TaxID=2100 RepID=A0ABD6IEV5_MESHY|nr:serine hydroxymethyltransferase [Mesomycoplasma hyorhinis]MXR06867.1 serine hydroxymethyltransferase [Mesomycoplasma hyorhinis]MXR09818.1 serine hydroxymethyltransferase [Mesomycoplasma hyorhinis]MXR11927.1 serine hydroxymethyltransferase [Mesomycoplasma hyorhinis]MXR39107.1 serine hydroxymethyltransferase [Mesomycoplasma hyorhinis]MXR44034.1 serine hydroxymethyltransferase [Mesomycoplasma hyorhinis]